MNHWQPPAAYTRDEIYYLFQWIDQMLTQQISREEEGTRKFSYMVALKLRLLSLTFIKAIGIF